MVRQTRVLGCRFRISHVWNCSSRALGRGALIRGGGPAPPGRTDEERNSRCAATASYPARRGGSSSLGQPPLIRAPVGPTVSGGEPIRIEVDLHGHGRT